jgi:hypothetical protein
MLEYPMTFEDKRGDPAYASWIVWAEDSMKFVEGQKYPPPPQKKNPAPLRPRTANFFNIILTQSYGMVGDGEQRADGNENTAGEGHDLRSLSG